MYVQYMLKKRFFQECMTPLSGFIHMLQLYCTYHKNPLYPLISPVLVVKNVLLQLYLVYSKYNVGLGNVLPET